MNPNTHFVFSKNTASGFEKIANIIPITEGNETWLTMLLRIAIIEGPTETNASEQVSLELNVWKEFINITRSLNREESFPRGSLFFLDQSVGVCGANIKNKKRENRKYFYI